MWRAPTCYYALTGSRQEKGDHTGENDLYAGVYSRPQAGVQPLLLAE